MAIDKSELKKVMVELSPNDVADPAEIAQVFQIVFAFLERIKDDSDKGDVTLRREIAAKTKELRLLAAAISNENKISVATLRKTVESLVKWKDKSEKSTTNEDVTVALSMAAENEIEIERVLAKIKNIQLSHGKDGEAGPIPDHEWDGTRIRFELPDGRWGDWVDLQGEPGSGGGFTMFGAGMGGVRGIKAGSGILVTGDPGEPTVSAIGGGGGTTTANVEPSGIVDDSNLAFVFPAKPLVVIVNNQTFRENHGWSWNSGSLTATLLAPVGTGGDIFGQIQS